MRLKCAGYTTNHVNRAGKVWFKTAVHIFPASQNPLFTYMKASVVVPMPMIPNNALV